MKVKELFYEQYQVVAVMDGDDCPAEDFLVEGEASTESSREGLMVMISHIAEYGFQNCPSGWTHEVSKPDGIYELIKGRLRLFFFKGTGKQIVVCTHGIMKKTQKASKQEVSKAKAYKDSYEAAQGENQLKVVKNENQQQD